MVRWMSGFLTVVLVSGCAGSLWAQDAGAEPLVTDMDSADEVAAAPEPDGAAEMARKLQDPLANISAITTDNGLLFRSGGGKTSYSFQIQPVQAFDFPEAGFSLIARGVVPIIGAAPATDLPRLNDAVPAARGGTAWGLGDISTQVFFAPKTDAAWKWGVGPVISFPTHTDGALAGPGWGVGPVGVLAGSLTEDVSLAVIGGHLWSVENSFSTTFVQPVLFYNIPDLPGVAIGYNASTTYDWTQNDLTLPLGISGSKTFDLGDGYGLDLSVGPYWNVVRPDGAPEWALKFGVTLLFP